MKLTERELRSYRPPSNDHIIFDDEIAGFGLRHRNGRGVWVFQYAIGSGKGRTQRRMKLGDYPALPPQKARRQAEDLHALVHLHGDPAAERKKTRVEAGNTLGKLVEKYLDFQRGELRPGSLGEVTRHLEKHAAALHHLPLASIDQQTIAQRLNVVAKTSGPSAANRTRASLSAMFSWGMREGEAAANPVAHTTKRGETSRDRVLLDNELKVIWAATGDDDFGVIIKLLMLTGQRRSEISLLRRAEVDFEHDLIRLPAERTKNGRPHDIAMASEVRRLLQSRPKIDGREFVFGRGPGPFRGWARAKRALDERIAAAGTSLQPWVMHDLRRSAATGMANLGVQPHVVEAVLNHASGRSTIAGVYNKASYSTEKAQALILWDEHIRALVQGHSSKIATLKRA